jgi:hypothetical protein
VSVGDREEAKDEEGEEEEGRSSRGAVADRDPVLRTETGSGEAFASVSPSLTEKLTCKRKRLTRAGEPEQQTIG